MHQHRQALACEQQCEQGGEHRQLAGTVVAGQHHERGVAWGQLVQAGVGGIQEAGHFFWRFALDAHGQTEGANLQVGHVAVEHLAKQVGRLLALQCPRAVFAAADFLDVLTDAHGGLSVMAHDFLP